MSKTRKHLYLNDNSWKYIAEYKEKNNARSESEAVEKIIDDNKKNLILQLNF